MFASADYVIRVPYGFDFLTIQGFQYFVNHQTPQHSRNYAPLGTSIFSHAGYRSTSFRDGKSPVSEHIFNLDSEGVGYSLSPRCLANAVGGGFVKSALYIQERSNRVTCSLELFFDN